MKKATPTCSHGFFVLCRAFEAVVAEGRKKSLWRNNRLRFSALCSGWVIALLIVLRTFAIDWSIGGMVSGRSGGGIGVGIGAAAGCGGVAASSDPSSPGYRLICGEIVIV